jgi:hypothetical protein
VGDDRRLDLVSKSQRRGRTVAGYFQRYEALDVALEVVCREGRLALAANVDGERRAGYLILLELEDGRVVSIRDFRYVSYIALEAEFERV